MRIAILGSGSSGNVAFVESGATADLARPTRVLVDAGLSEKATRERLAALDGGPQLEEIDAVLVTHGHADHAAHASALERPIFAPAAARRSRGLEATRVLAGVSFAVGALTITPVLLPHDAEETVGYVLADHRHRVGILTDCGRPDEDVARAYAGCDVLVLEANHDPMLLMDGPYPPSLQRRVRGPRGHLSNAQSAQMLRMILDYGAAPALVIAAHLSRKNNRPELVERALRPCLPRGTRLWLTTPVGAPMACLPLPFGPARQLGLFEGALS